MSEKPDIHRLLELQVLLQQFNKIDRMVHRKHGTKMDRENDTEHSYNLAMTAWFLASHFPKLDRDLLIRYALVHDLVEIHAGDTYAFASSDELATKHEREKVAAQKLQADWEDFPEIHSLISSYEDRSTPESCFVYALDKIMPIMLIYIHEGYTWQKEGITSAQLHAAKASKIALSPEVNEYYQELYTLLLKSPHYFNRPS